MAAPSRSGRAASEPQAPWRELTASSGEQIAQMGTLMRAALREVAPVPLAYSVDAVLDGQGQLWWLELNSHPLFPHSGYDVMLCDIYNRTTRCDVLPGAFPACAPPRPGRRTRPGDNSRMASMQLQEILFSQGFGTRRVCAGLVQQGHVIVTARLATTPADEFEAVEGLRFTVQGTAWEYHEKAYLMLHKAGGL
jgi:hypothetical protein